jgi:hypothetical protein
MYIPMVDSENKNIGDALVIKRWLFNEALNTSGGSHDKFLQRTKW